MTTLQHHIYDAFLEFKRICAENNLRYWASAGTLIGAVIHKGFIPWDDDMDIIMPREDYTRFVDIVLHSGNGRYGISCFEDGKHLCPYYFAKFYIKDCTLWESKQFPNIIGPWVDVFPVDNYNEQDGFSLNDQYILAIGRYRRSISHQTWGDIYRDLRRGYITNAMMKTMRKCFSRFARHNRYARLLEIRDKITKLPGDHAYFLYGQEWSDDEGAKRFIFEKELLQSFVEVPFEDTTIFIPEHFHEILLKGYPHYQVIPPVEQRYGGHPCYYVDLDHVKTIDEVRAELGDDDSDRESVFTFKEFWKVLKERIRYRKENI